MIRNDEEGRLEHSTQVYLSVRASLQGKSKVGSGRRHWCDECERKSWNYGVRAKKDQFFAQVWNPLHTEEELREYPKEVSELDVE